jgi:hypothetical protein
LQQLTDQGWQKINDLSQRYGVSTDAVMTMLQAVVNGNGTMAQFYHPELGGGGQWMQGGMTMVGDMFNYGLKAKVDGLCGELSQLLAQQPFVPSPPTQQAQWQGGQQQSQGGYGGTGSSNPGSVSMFMPGSSGNWWPAELGMPNGSGAQNNIRYAYFSNPGRLAVDLNGHVTVYDTLDHQIGGVSQQQGSGASLTFTSQYGTVNVANLPIVSVDGVAQGPPTTMQPTSNQTPRTETPQEADIFSKIERLADLQRKGIISQEEYAAKKSELMGRL